MSPDHRTPATLPRPLPGTPPFPAVPVARRFTLENGLRVVAVHRGEFPQVSARLILPAGSIADPASSPGAASLVAALVTEGTEALQGIEIHERIDSLGASLGARAGHDFTEVDIVMLAETLEAGLGLMAEVVARAAFPDREVERVRAESLDALEARLDEPANVADDHASEAVFGADHPYARLPLGTVEGVEALRRETLVDFHRRHYRPAGSVLVMAGDLGSVDLRALLESSLGRWEGAAAAIHYPPPLPASPAAGRLQSVEWEDSAQGEIRVAGLGMPRSSADWAAAAVANYVLGGSTITGRLGANLREEKGWTYGVRSGFAAGVQAAGWVVETAVEAGATADAIAEIVAELNRMVRERVADDELERAREALILSLPRAFETPARIVSRLATVEAFGLEHDYWTRFAEKVRRVGPDEVQAVAGRYFDPATLVRVAVGPRLAAAVDGG